MANAKLETTTRIAVEPTPMQTSGASKGPRAAALPPGKGKSMKKKRRGITKSDELRKAVVQETFYAGGQSSYESAGTVARRLGLTIPAVSSLLKAAHDRGEFFVDVTIPYEEFAMKTLAARVKAQYGLIDVQLVPGDDDMLAPSSLQHRRTVHRDTIRSLVRLAATYLDECLMRASDARHPAPLLGVSWGFTAQAFAAHLRTTPRPVTMPSLEVVPIIGATGVSYSGGVEANVVAADIARLYGGQSSQLPCPAFVKRLGEAAVVKRQRQVKAMLKKIAGCEWVLSSMGEILPRSEAAARMANDQMLSDELASLAVGAGAVAQVCGWCVDAEGNEVQTEFEAIGLGYDGLRNLAANSQKRVILVTGGDQRRVEPLRAILKARLASVLITDTVTARVLVGAS